MILNNIKKEEIIKKDNPYEKKEGQFFLNKKRQNYKNNINDENYEINNKNENFEIKKNENNEDNNYKSSKTSDEFLDMESYIKGDDEEENKFDFNKINKKHFYICLFLIIFSIISLIIGLILLNISLNSSISLIVLSILIFIPTTIFMKTIITSGYKKPFDD